MFFPQGRKQMGSPYMHMWFRSQKYSAAEPEEKREIRYEVSVLQPGEHPGY